MTERDFYIALNMMDNVGPVRVRAVREALGSLEEIWRASERELSGVEGIGPGTAASLFRGCREIDPSVEVEKASRLGARLVTPADPDYPENLAKIYDPPLALYVMGDFRPEDRQAIGVVGSRRCTYYGQSAADRLSYQLGKAGFTVVSGLARGIDWSAHEGALKSGGRTIAVLGSSLDNLYPPEGRPLAERILGQKQGAVISEYTLGRPTDRTTFPYRNRIISGLSLGVLVVEADVKSGSLITAEQALEQGRSVFAVPGRIDSPSSRGTNRLIKNGARLVDDVADLFDELEFLKPETAVAGSTDDAPGGAVSIRFSDREKGVVAALLDGPADVDTLARRAGLKSAELSAMLVTLELKRAIRMLPGRRVELTVTPPAEVRQMNLL